MSKLLASELYASSQGAKCGGPVECHYCSGPCQRQWTHNEPPRLPFTRFTTTAKRPNSLYICNGCRAWHRKRVTVSFLDGSFKDFRDASDYSWWMTWGSAKAINQDLFIEENKQKLYQLLLKPPTVFCLSLIEKGCKNNLQLALVNDLTEINQLTELVFTLNNVPYRYTIQQLEQTLYEDEDRRKRSLIDPEAQAQGKEPGVLALVSLLGGYDVPWRDRSERKVGRPKKVEPR